MEWRTASELQSFQKRIDYVKSDNKSSWGRFDKDHKYKKSDRENIRTLVKLMEELLAKIHTWGERAGPGSSLSFFMIFNYVKIQNLGIRTLFTESKKLAVLQSYEFLKLTRFHAFPIM